MFKLTEIETRRLVLGRVRPEHIPAIYRYSSDPNTNRWNSFRPPKSERDTQEYVMSVIERSAKSELVPWAMTVRKTGDMIGTCGFSKISCKNRRAALGAVLDSKHWGNGYMLEALNAVLKHGFSRLALGRIEATMMSGHDAGHRLLRLLGMKAEGTLRQYKRTYSGEVHDVEMYSILRSEWNNFAPSTKG